MTSLKEILSVLPTLNVQSLDVVIATATALKVGGREFPSRSSKSSGKKKKVAIPTKSEFAGVPEFEEFRARNKELKALLASKNTDLKSFQASSPSNEVLASFLKARECWFRVKATLPRNPSQKELSSTEKPPSTSKTSSEESKALP
jgi:hypothetical protein